MLTVPPDLAPRFQPPADWTNGYFENPDTGHSLHYGCVAPESTPKAVVVLLGGLSEFSEKYFELIHDMLARGHAVYTMDWHYQGRSGRFPGRPHKRHSDGYGQDISDLDLFIRTIVQPACPGLPALMIAHSMGGHLGLRYLSEHPDVFSGAVLSAPMLGIRSLRPYRPVLPALLCLLSPFQNSYVPGGGDWQEDNRKSNGTDIFSSDLIRDQIHQAWSVCNPALRVGSPTMRWIKESLASCRRMARADRLQNIRCPVVFALAGQDKLVDNAAIRHASACIPQAALLDLDNAKHEILMETDDSRDQVLKAFDGLAEKACKDSGFKAD